MECLAKSKNVTHNMQACDMETCQSNPKMAVWGKNHSLKRKFSEFFYESSIEQQCPLPPSPHIFYRLDALPAS